VNDNLCVCRLRQLELECSRDLSWRAASKIAVARRASAGFFSRSLCVFAFLSCHLVSLIKLRGSYEINHNIHLLASIFSVFVIRAMLFILHICQQGRTRATARDSSYWYSRRRGWLFAAATTIFCTISNGLINGEQEWIPSFYSAIRSHKSDPDVKPNVRYIPSRTSARSPPRKWTHSVKPHREEYRFNYTIFALSTRHENRNCATNAIFTKRQSYVLCLHGKPLATIMQLEKRLNEWKSMKLFRNRRN